MQGKQDRKKLWLKSAILRQERLNILEWEKLIGKVTKLVFICAALFLLIVGLIKY